MTKKDDGFVVRYTNKDIMDKLDSLHADQIKTLNQALKTNGRVTMLEKRSIGVWISNNIFKFIIFVGIFFAVVISDVRHPLVEFLMRFL